MIFFPVLFCVIICWELFLAPKILQHKDDDEDEEFLFVGSCFSSCSTALSKKAFLYVKTNFSRYSSFSDLLEIQNFQRRSIL